MNQTAESQQPLKNKFLLDRKEHEKLSPLFQKVQLSELCKTIKGSMNDQYIDPYNKCKGADSKKLFDSKKFCNFRTETIRMVPSLDMKNTTMLWTKLNPEGFVNFANLSIVSKLNNPSFDNLFTKIDLLIGGQRMDSILPHNLSVLLALHGYKYVLEPNPKTGETTIHIPLPFSLFDNEYGGFPLTTLMHHSPLIQMDIKPDNIISACLTLHKNDTNQVINDSREWFIHQTQNTSCEVTNLKETFNIPFNHPQQMLYFCFTDDKDIIITDPKILETVQSVQLQMLENKSFQKSEKDDSTTLVLNKNELNSPMHSTSLLPGYYFINFSEMNPVQDIGSSLNFSRFEAPTLSVQLDNSALQPSWLGSFFVSATPGIKRCKIAGFGPNIFKTKSGLGGVFFKKNVDLMTGKKPSLTFNNLAGTTPPFLSLGPTVKSFYKEDLVSTKSTLINANSFENGTGGNNNVDNDGQIVYKSKQHIVTGLSFNQTQTCISGCLNGYKDLIQNKTICDNNSKHGFVIYDARSGRQIWINEQFKVKVIMVRMIFRTNFFLFVVELPHNGLQRIFFYDDHTNKKIADFAFPNKVIKNILATKDRLIIVTEQQILIRKIAFEYSAAGEFKTFRETQNEESIETGKNVYGACGVSYDKTNFILACPAARDGDILLFWSSDKKTTTTIKGAHFSTLRILSMNFEGTRLASVSEKGTVIRVYDTSTPSAGTNANSSKCILEFRRGLEPTIVTSLTFDLKSEWLALSSSHGTIHVFSLLPEKQNTDFSFNLAGIHKYVLSMARVTTQIVSLRAFSKYTITEGKNPIVCFQDQSESETETADKNTIRMSILTEEGFHSQISFNRNCPGQESKLIKHTTMQEIFMF